MISDQAQQTDIEQSEADDVQRVLGELAALLDQGALSFSGPLGADGGAWAKLEALQWVNPHLPIGWPSMPKGLLPKLAAYAKKVVRVGLRWYINPLVEQQNSYNQAVTDGFQALLLQVARLEGRVVELEAKLEQHSRGSSAERPPDGTKA